MKEITQNKNESYLACSYEHVKIKSFAAFKPSSKKTVSGLIQLIKIPFIISCTKKFIENYDNNGVLNSKSITSAGIKVIASHIKLSKITFNKDKTEIAVESVVYSVTSGRKKTDKEICEILKNEKISATSILISESLEKDMKEIPGALSLKNGLQITGYNITFNKIEFEVQKKLHSIDISHAEDKNFDPNYIICLDNTNAYNYVNNIEKYIYNASEQKICSVGKWKMMHIVNLDKNDHCIIYSWHTSNKQVKVSLKMNESIDLNISYETKDGFLVSYNNDLCNVKDNIKFNNKSIITSASDSEFKLQYNLPKNINEAQSLIKCIIAIEKLNIKYPDYNPIISVTKKFNSADNLKKYLFEDLMKKAEFMNSPLTSKDMKMITVIKIDNSDMPNDYNNHLDATDAANVVPEVNSLGVENHNLNDSLDL